MEVESPGACMCGWESPVRARQGESRAPVNKKYECKNRFNWTVIHGEEAFAGDMERKKLTVNSQKCLLINMK